ncbi:hypothetical protein A9P82_07265 [Arachidicoccus ginsenosidimutans]|uniref:hypothetical protein n=1 Tax=Arachidicoccus sp. BS20 TaxID=1850526 RepID=UPI0007F0BC98|nr:hypothetical protein [Arachidicoccus sp. BS20]ANI89106.1 hypothetical protein A9P82_07265 [Arachidicoccus sp. BS20]
MMDKNLADLSQKLIGKYKKALERISESKPKSTYKKEVKKERDIFDIEFIQEYIKNKLLLTFDFGNIEMSKFISDIFHITIQELHSFRSITYDYEQFEYLSNQLLDELNVYSFLFFKAVLESVNSDDAYKLLLIRCDQFLHNDYSYEKSERWISFIRNNSLASLLFYESLPLICYW